MIYLLTFIITLLFIYIKKHSKEKFIQYLCSFIIIGLLSSIAGFRNLTVGIDTSAYPVQAFSYALNCTSIADLIFFPLEPLYGLLAFLVSRFTDEVTYFLFITHFIICGLFYLTALRSKDYKQTYMFMFIFMFLCYNQSINISRQYLAISVFIYSFYYLVNEKYLKYTIGIFIAMLFHTSACICFIFLFIHKYKIYQNKLLCNITLISLLILLISYEKLFPILLSILGLPSKFQIYNDADAYKGAFSLSELILRFTFIGICIETIIIKYKKEPFIAFFFLISIIEFMLNLMQIHSRFINRISLYPFMLYLVYLPKILYINKSINLRKKRIILYSICIVYWFYVFYIQNAGETFPYKSDLLGI